MSITGSAARASRPRILFVEDDAVLRSHLATTLAEEYMVDTAADGAQALLSVIRAKPDLVIADIVMPVMDGLELLKTLRGEPNTRAIPVLLISGRAIDEQRIEGFREGADGYLAKPYTERELRAVVSSLLHAVQVRTEAARRGAREQALAERAALLESITDVLFALDRELRFTYANPPALEHFGNGADKLIGRRMTEAFPAVEHMGISRELARALDEQRSVTFETLSPFTRQWIEVRVYPSRDGLTVSFRNIDERKRAEREIQQANARLDAEVQAMNRLHELVARLLAHTTLQGALQEVLDASLALLGAQMGNVQLLKPGTRVLEIVAHRGFGPKFLDHFRSVVVDDECACGRALRLGERVIIDDIDADPGFVPYREQAAEAGFRAVQSTPLRSRSGVSLGMISTHFRQPHRPAERALRILDLYARQAADFIERMRYEVALEEADRRKNQFIAILAHELRNPLAPIRNGLHIMRMHGSADAESQRIVNMMERQTTHLVHLLDDLLDLSRVTHGKLKLRRSRIGLQEAVSEAIESMRSFVEQRGHELLIDMRAPGLQVNGDRDRLVQVFSNLLSNSAKFTERGGRIAVTLDSDGGEAVVTVRDSGVGIQPEALKEIFEMFSPYHRGGVGNEGGLGIGLSIVRGLVQLHTGSIEASSGGPGQGSTFTVRLPLAGSTSRH